MVDGLGHLENPADVGGCLALGDQLLNYFALADDLLRGVPGAFHGEVPGPVWPSEDSHSPWSDCRGYDMGEALQEALPRFVAAVKALHGMAGVERFDPLAVDKCLGAGTRAQEKLIFMRALDHNRWDGVVLSVKNHDEGSEPPPASPKTKH